MKYRLRIYPAAVADVDEAALYIAQNSLDSALRFYDAVDRTFHGIRQDPTCWPKYEIDHPKLGELRKTSIAGFRNFLVFYIVQAGVVQIVRVLHGARDIPSILSEDTGES
jgi:toxin ParE1/3/4